MAALVAVYRDRDTADAVARAVRAREGVSADAVRVGNPRDARDSILAEMDEETAQTWNSGLWGVMTSDMWRGALLLGTVGALIGAVLGIPLGYFLYDDTVSGLTRIGLGALIGALFGSVVGSMIGGGMAVKSPEEGLAAERGVPVVVEDPPDGAEALLAEHDPIRIDRIVDGRRVATPTTEAPSGLSETVGELVANARDPRRR